MYFIFLLLVTVRGWSSTLSTIEDCIHNYMYIYDVDDMCSIVQKRMSYKGIFIQNSSICTEAPIQSDYGDTLRDLYEYYEQMDESYMQKPMKSFTDAQHNVFKYCSLILDVAWYVNEIYPDFKYNECFQKFGEAGDETCNPVPEIHIGNVTNIILWSPSMEKCLYYLDEMIYRRTKYSDAQLFLANMPGIIAVEKSKAWLHALPSWLVRHVVAPNVLV